MIQNEVSLKEAVSSIENSLGQSRDLKTSSGPLANLGGGHRKEVYRGDTKGIGSSSVLAQMFYPDLLLTC